jgi:hypothetical protein
VYDNEEKKIKEEEVRKEREAETEVEVARLRDERDRKVSNVQKMMDFDDLRELLVEMIAREKVMIERCSDHHAVKAFFLGKTVALEELLKVVKKRRKAMITYIKLREKVDNIAKTSVYEEATKDFEGLIKAAGERVKKKREEKAVKEDYESCYMCGKPAVTRCLYCAGPLCEDHHQDTGETPAGDKNLPVCKPGCEVILHERTR